MLYFSVHDSTVFQKISQKHCYHDKYGSYPTESAAKTACAADSNCRGVYDYDCDNKSPYRYYFLCPLSVNVTFAPSEGDCVYEKKTQGNGNCSNIYNLIVTYLLNFIDKVILNDTDIFFYPYC